MSGTLYLLLLATGLTGPLGQEASAGPAEASDAQRGVVFVAGGIGGLDFVVPAAQFTLPHAGVEHEVRTFDWTHGKCRYLKDLQDEPHLRQKAGELAEQVRMIKAVRPERPIYLVGHSAGAGLVLWAAEQLPPGTVERIILLSPAVAPSYDLCPALRATRAEIVSFNSSFDRLILGWGTSQFGTVDHIYGPAAGMSGFQVPERLDATDRALYDRLVQIDWKPEMLFKQHGGLHASTTMPGFLARYVAPWLRP